MKVKKVGISDKGFALWERLMKEAAEDFNPKDHPLTYRRLRSPLKWMLPGGSFAAYAATCASSLLRPDASAFDVFNYFFGTLPALAFGLLGYFIYLMVALFKDEAGRQERRNEQVFTDIKESLLRHPVRSWAVKQEVIQGDQVRRRAFCLYCEDENGRRFTEIMVPVEVNHFGRQEARLTVEGWGAPRETSAKS